MIEESHANKNSSSIVTKPEWEALGRKKTENKPTELQPYDFQEQFINKLVESNSSTNDTVKTDSHVVE